MNMIGYEVKKQDQREEIKEGPSIWNNCKDQQDHHDDSDDYFAKTLKLRRNNRSSLNSIVFRSLETTQNTTNTVSAGASEDHCVEGVSDFTFDDRDDQDIDQEVDQRVLSEVQEISTIEETEENDFTLDAAVTRSSSA